MKIKILFFTLLFFTVFCLKGYSQSNKDKFSQAFSNGDTTTQIKILADWKKVTPDDPDYYVSAFNYYAKRGLTEVLSLSTIKPSSDAFELKDKTNKTVGYLGSSPSFNEKFIKEGFMCIDSAIAKFPTRLDMRFGKVYVLGRVFDYDRFTQEIILAIDYGQTIKNKWLWRDGKPLDDAEKFIASTIQSYINQLFQAGDTQTGNMRLISQEVLKYYPDNVENLSDLSITYMIDKQYDKALSLLLRAEKIAPQDYIVLNNIGYCYELQKDKVNAIKYYELVKKYGSDDAKQDASKKIENLNKKNK
ncbi:MAG TPA: hypothetical protein VL442_16895 [Mucilaginibacter sp.]|jgi:tetratricopeptide (TPR) repeat protein|nr:hypothetical protein [Mucilaginibacter sp.]